jgi:hypothetical protein
MNWVVATLILLTAASLPAEEDRGPFNVLG